MNSLTLVLRTALCLLLHLLPAYSAPTTLTGTSQWEPDIEKFEASDATNRPPPGCIIFVGSSSIRRWVTLAKDFRGLPVFNRGFGGSQLSDSVEFADRIIIPYQPRQVVIYAGSNDINAHKEPAVVFGELFALVTKIRAALPHTRIAYISIAPNPARWEQLGQIRELNKLAEAYCRRESLDFINVFPLMLGPDGQPKPDIFVEDRLHMNEKGYAIWREAIAPYLH